MFSAITFFAASLISPFFVEVSPEMRSTYVSLGKLLEDRPMMVVGSRVGFDTGRFGRFGVRNWEVSSLTGRRLDVHRHALYHSEFGPTWQYGIELAEKWRLASDLTRSWTIYRGFKGPNDSSNCTYHWWQLDQSLENPYLVPFWRIRKAIRVSKYLYFKAGVRRKFRLWENVALTPSVFAEGGSSKCVERIVGKNPYAEKWDCGPATVSFRLELSWSVSEWMSFFAYAEQYMVVGGEERTAIGRSSYRCAHSDWTYGGIGARIKF